MEHGEINSIFNFFSITIFRPIAVLSANLICLSAHNIGGGGHDARKIRSVSILKY